MEKNTIFGITLDVCPDCEARWFDLGELEALMEKKEEAGIEPPITETVKEGEIARFQLEQTKVQYRDCPRCSKKMMRRNFEQISGVMVDSCPRDGIFLDDNEFGRLRAFIKTKGPERAKQLRDEERQRHLRQMANIKKIESARQEDRSRRRPEWGLDGDDEWIGAISTVGGLVKNFFSS
jgi:Zn-finger nucleic acid-binding protein